MGDTLEKKVADLEELLEDLQALELLEKGSFKCVRCSNTVSTKGGRCASCLKKLRTNKKKPGTYEHEHKLADDALRRQDGKNGTASKKSNGRGSRKSIIKQVRAAYKKHGKGKTLSPDRKDNTKGYSSGNTRMIPKELNRGRHNADEKKVKKWKDRVKKSELELNDFLTLLRAYTFKADPELAKTLDTLSNEELVELLDEEEKELL